MSGTFQRNTVVNTALLLPHPRNYKKHSEQQLQKLCASLRRFKQVRSIVVQEKGDGYYTIVAGHGVVEASRRLGWSELRADVLPASWSDTDVEGYLVADNRLHQELDVDESVLVSLLQGQKAAGFELFALGSSEQEYKNLLNMADFSMEQALPALPSFSQPLALAPESTPVGLEEAPKPFRPQIISEIPKIPSQAVPEIKFETYQNSQVRQIILIFNVKEYAWALQVLGKVREEHPDFQNNTETIIYLLKEYVDAYGLDIPCPEEAKV